MTATAKINARGAKRVATHERLFTAAVAEFKRSGMAGADVAVIVEAAGVAHGTFFFHFPTKEHVVAELGQREEVRMAAELDRFLATRRDLKATLLEVERLAGLLERRLGTVLFKDMLALYFSPHRPELRLWPEHPLITRVIAEFERAHEEGEIADDADPANTATIFLLALYALLIIHERKGARRDAIEGLVTSVLRGAEVR